MFARLTEIRQEVQDLASWLHREESWATEAESLLKEVTALENTCASMRVLLSARLAGTELWRKRGERSAAHWVAKATGTTVGQAVGTLETAKRLERLPGTAEVFRAGRMSETQAREIASAASVDPSSEDRLLDTAKTGDLTGLKEECRRVQSAAAKDEGGRYEAIYRSRYPRSWTEDGAFRLDARLTPDAGATVMASLEPHRQRVFEEARSAGRRESQEAYLADALVALAENPSPTERSGPRALVHVRVDHAALVRGRTERGETCEIPGVGPIPVATARALSSDAILPPSSLMVPT
jgi:uncharacterized protein DUF222